MWLQQTHAVCLYVVFCSHDIRHNSCRFVVAVSRNDFSHISWSFSLGKSTPHCALWTGHPNTAHSFEQYLIFLHWGQRNGFSMVFLQILHWFASGNFTTSLANVAKSGSIAAMVQLSQIVCPLFSTERDWFAWNGPCPFATRKTRRPFQNHSMSALF